MTRKEIADQEFLSKLDEIIHSNMHDEDFRVPQLAEELGMSRHTLHRKLIEVTKLSTSQYIRQVRLKAARKLLREKSMSVSEIAFKVGFSSPVYFSKCFHEYFGYPPSQIGLREEDSIIGSFAKSTKRRRAVYFLFFSLATLTLLLFGLMIPLKNYFNKSEKSIVVLLPSIIGQDSTDIPLISGSVEAVINNLCLVRDLTVHPMSTSRKYRGSNLSGADIGKELNANYVVETDGAILDDRLQLNVKLIDVEDGTQVWYQLFEAENQDQIQLPNDIAQSLVRRINAEITPEEKERIQTTPTTNTQAWTEFLKGKDMYNEGMALYMEQGEPGSRGPSRVKGLPQFQRAIEYFLKSLEYDENFALAYAQLAITYEILNYRLPDMDYSREINYYAEKAYINDDENDLCLIAKSYQWINQKEYQLAIPYLEKAIVYNPKSATSYRILAELYNLPKVPNSAKYAEYKVLTVKHGALVEDSTLKSDDNRLAARALRVTGFYDDAKKYIAEARRLNPMNLSAVCEESEIMIEEKGDYLGARENLMKTLAKDSTNLEILRYIYTNLYLSNDLEGAYNYYQKLSAYDPTLSFLAAEDFSCLAVICRKLGKTEEAKTFQEQFKALDRFGSNAYKRSYMFARLHCLEGNNTKALEQLNILSRQPYQFGYIIRMLKDDPVFNDIREFPDFKKVIFTMEETFQKNHKETFRALMKRDLTPTSTWAAK